MQRPSNGQRVLRNDSLCVTNTSEDGDCQRLRLIYSKNDGFSPSRSAGNSPSWPWAERIPHFTRLQCFGVNIQSPGVKLTPQLDWKKKYRVCVCVSTLASMCAWACVCVYTQLCFLNDTYSHIPFPRKTGWPQHVSISWRSPALASAVRQKKKKRKTHTDTHTL